jgi:hypothetical protein
MPANDQGGRKARLAAALKENLKRRKHQARTKGQDTDGTPRARNLGTAPQAGLENRPEGGQKSAPKSR